MAIIQQAATYHVQEWSSVFGEWYATTIATEHEQEGRDNLAELRRMYPQGKFRLVKIERVVTVIEGEAT